MCIVNDQNVEHLYPLIHFLIFLNFGTANRGWKIDLISFSVKLPVFLEKTKKIVKQLKVYYVA